MANRDCLPAHPATLIRIKISSGCGKKRHYEMCNTPGTIILIQDTKVKRVIQSRESVKYLLPCKYNAGLISFGRRFVNTLLHKMKKDVLYFLEYYNLLGPLYIFHFSLYMGFSEISVEAK